MEYKWTNIEDLYIVQPVINNGRTAERAAVHLLGKEVTMIYTLAA